jgi:hypothetical protein
VIVSDALIWLEASWVIWVIGISLLVSGIPGPSVLAHWRATVLVVLILV